MRNGVLLLLVLLGLQNCTPPKYVTKRDSELMKIDLDNSTINYIPIADNYLKESKILDSTCFLIQNNKYSRLDKFLNSLESSGNKTAALYLSKTLLFITKKDYVNATKSVQLINDPDYLLLKQLLSIDLSYEISKSNGSFDYNELLKNYQDMIDSFPDSSLLRKIVAIRLRYLRYSY